MFGALMLPSQQLLKQSSDTQSFMVNMLLRSAAMLPRRAETEAVAALPSGDSENCGDCRAL